MPTQPFIKFIYKRQPIEGKSKILDVDGCWRGLEFSLPMLNNSHEGYYGVDTNTRQWAISNGVFQSRCEPLTVWLEFGAFAPLLYKAWSIGENIDRIEIYWTHYYGKTGKEEVYLTHKLYPAKIISMTFVMPDVKDKQYERYGHNIRLQFLYRFTEITYVKGYHHHKLEWYNYLSLGQGGNDRDRYYIEQDMKGWVLDEQPTRGQRLAGIEIHSLSWEHADVKRKDDKETVVGDAVKLSVDVDGGREGSTVIFEIYYQPQSENAREFDRTSGKLTEGTATADWTVNFDKIKGKSFLDKSYNVYFTACYEGKYGRNRDIPVVPAKIACDFVEIPDVHFNFDSPLPCLDAKGNLIAVLVAAFKFANKNLEKEVVIFGHTDTKGDPAHNFDLSKWRAEAVKALIDNDRNRWVDLADVQATIEDQQCFLAALTKRHGWNCDPGAIDGKDGPKTKAAREAFQRQYNEKHNGGLKIDGIFGEKSWGAMFDVQRRLIEEAHEAETGESTFPALVYAYGGKSVYPCGESFPIDSAKKDDYRSAENRRVEIVFFDKGKCPRLLDHPKKTEQVALKECPVYDARCTERRPIQFEAMEIKSGRVQLVIPWFFDCHMHINSGHCAPTPLSKSKVPVPFMNQQRLDWLGEKALGDFGQLQKLSTNEIGDAAVVASEPVMRDPELKFLGEVGKRRRLLVSMPMDMDRAHYRGYEGRMIYENVNSQTMWWNEKDGRYESVSPKDEAMWERYKMQVERTASAFYANNGALVSFYNYDPRARLANWRLPFEKNLIQTASPLSFPKNLPAIGIKMYTALGYRPLDGKLNFPWHEYYGLCASKQIPIICHGSRGGMTTHDILVYYEREYPKSANVADSFKQSWFTDNFVSPYAWEPVLQKHPTLTLCLAHFGGDTFWDRKVNPYCDAFWKDLKDRDEKNWIAGFLYLMKTYPNFYVDLSYFLFEPSMVEYFKKALAFDPVVKERILFGTDWWMFTMAGQYKNGGYLKYFNNMSDRILSITDQSFFEQIGVKNARELLAYFMVINPMRFLQIKKHVGKLADAFYKDELVIKRKAKFALEEWINDVPDSIEGLYK